MTISNRKLRLALPSGLAIGLLVCANAAFAQSASIPAALEGTYSLTFESAQAGAPLENGTSIDMVIAPGGTVCIADLVLSSPEVSGAEAIWGVPELGVQLAVSDVGSGTFNEANILSSSGAFLGQFSGQKVSNSVSCSLLGGTPPDMSLVADMVAKAEQLYGDLFPTDTLNNAFSVLDGYIYRHYASAGTYIGIKDGTVYVMGDAFGQAGPVTIGTIANTWAQLESELTGEPVEPIDEPEVEIPGGDYSLTIAGTVTTSGISTPFTFEIDSIEAPGDAEVSTLEDKVKEALADAEDVDVSSFSDFQISEVSVGDSRVFYRAQFVSVSTTQTPIGPITSTVAYNLTFEFLKK